MTDIKKRCSTGETLEVRIDRTGNSGDYIAYPTDEPRGNRDTKNDGVHLKHKQNLQVGDLVKVKIDSMADGYPKASVLKLVPSSKDSGVSVSDQGPRKSSGVSSEVESLVDEFVTTVSQNEQNPRSAASERDFGRQTRTDVGNHWRT